MVSTEEFGEPAQFGTEARDGQSWAGDAPTAGPYFIAIVAHPEAHYTLRVTVETSPR